MHSSTRLAMDVCFALGLFACSAGRQPLRSNDLHDAAVTAGMPDGAVEVDARANREDIHDSPAALPEVVRVTCGNGRLAPGEECDDGNATPKDGCSAECTIEPGWVCRVPGRRCVPQADAGIDLGDNHAICGDGVLSELEECDCGDGTRPVPEGCGGPNADDDYDGCTRLCLWGPFCGDGQVNGSEDCDLGRRNGQLSGKDGCTPGCTQAHYCGDGLVDTVLGEECDLGALNGLVLDSKLEPATAPDGVVHCSIECRIPHSVVY